MVSESILPEKARFSYIQSKPYFKIGIIGGDFCANTIPRTKKTLQQTCQQIVLLFSKEIAYRVYDEFDETQIEYENNGDLIAYAKMPVDTWLIGYLLSFGTNVEVMEPKYLRTILAEQAQGIYEKNKT